MPKTQRIIWTALPNGFTGNTLKLSVFVSPRLYNDTDTQLNAFPDFAAWPQHVSAVNFSIELKGGQKLKAKVVSEAPDNGLWTTIFKPATYVRAYKAPQTHKRIIRTYPVADVMAYLKGVYTNIGDQSPTALPKLSLGTASVLRNSLQDLFNKLGALRDERARLEKKLDFELARPGVNAFDPKDTHGLSREQFAFLQVDMFYDRKRNKNLQDEQLHPKPVPERLPKPKLDFHQMVGALGDYPGVERGSRPAAGRRAEWFDELERTDCASRQR